MQDIREFMSVFIPILYIIIFVMGIIGNGLVVITYVFYKKMRSMTDLYLLNLAVADIMFIATLPFWAVYESNQWIFGTFVCKFLKGVYSINFYSGVLLLAVISVDRYIAIVHATKSFNYRGKALLYGKIICAVTWLLVITASLPDFIYCEVYDFTTSGQKLCEIRYPKEWSKIGKLIAPSIQLSLGFFGPLLVMFFCYSMIIHTLLRVRSLQRHKAVRVVMAVVAAFVVCQVPYNITTLIETSVKNLHCEALKRLSLAKTVTKCLAFFHCCLNPILYVFIGVKFRFYFSKIIRDVWCLSKKYITFRYIQSRRTSEVFTSRRTSEFEIDTPSSFTM
ncbi:C-C chemokine receptor type 6 [Callorhinchus milii]|nr:C-C chemokine receptor type 6 [Callorhinchus milii]